MKNKILKTLGVGALCCVGALTFAGCSAEVSQEQTDKLIESAQTAGDNLQSLKESNLAQQELIKELNKKIDELTKQSKKLTADEANNLIKLAQFNLCVQREELTSNCKLVETQYDIKGNKIDERITYYFKTEDGTRVALYSDKDLSLEDFELIYELPNGDCYYYESSKGTKTKVYSFDVGASTLGYQGSLLYKSLVNMAYDTYYNSYTIDENGNYIVRYLMESTEENRPYTVYQTLAYVVDTNNLLVEMKYNGYYTNITAVNDKTEYGYDTLEGLGQQTDKLLIGAVTEADIAEHLQIAMNAEIAE